MKKKFREIGLVDFTSFLVWTFLNFLAHSVGTCDINEDQSGAMMTVENVAEEITKAASEVVHEQFLKSMVYEKTSGLYYDQNSGYYYDANKVSKIKSIYFNVIPDLHIDIFYFS